MADVLMPRLSDSMEEGTILRWLKLDGAAVASGEDLVEIETDKATMSYEADHDGVLRIIASEGSTLPIGAVIATVDGDVTAAVDRASGASPLARRTAERIGLAIESIVGTGPRGRVLRRDVLAAQARGATPVVVAEPVAMPRSPSVEPQAETQASATRGDVAVVELTRLQRTVAQRMAESTTTVPHFALEVDVNMGAALELRRRLSEVAERAPSINDLVIKACAGVLRRHPRVNGAYRDGRFECYGRVNVGMAVAADDALVVPTIFDADQRSLASIATEARRLSERVRAGSITPSELDGATFTISNLGMLGIDRFTAVINAPQAAILCVGAVVARPVLREDGEIMAGSLMTLTLVSDHRILYGADAARFLGDLRAALEAPLAVLL